MSRIASLCLPLSLCLGACASPGGDYPSLAIRDAERAQGSFSSPERKTIDVPPVETDLTGPLDQTLVQLVAATEAAHADFLEIAPRARKLVAAAGSSEVGSTAWASAEVALSELDSARSLAAIPLGDIDTLYSAARVAAGDVAAIEAARARITAIIAEEDETLAQLRER